MTREVYEQYKADCLALQKQVDKVLAYTRHDTLSGFATKPSDLEKRILSYDGGTVMSFVTMQNTCARHGSAVDVVTDAEGEIVALAPREIATLISKLLNESHEVDSHVFI